MPLQNLAGGFETEGFKGPTALDQIDARRSARDLQELERYKAESERTKADEYAAAGQHGRTQTEGMQKYAQGGPKMPTKEQGPQAVMEGLRQRAAYLVQSPYQELQQKGVNMIQQLDAWMKSGKGGTGTIGERVVNTDMEFTEAKTEEALANAQYARAGKPTATKPNNMPIGEQIDTEEKLFGYSNANLGGYFPNLESQEEDGDVIFPRLDGTSRSFFYETFKAELDRVTKGQGKKEVDPDIVNSTFRRVVSRYKVIEYDPLGFGDYQVLIPTAIYDRLKQAMGEGATDKDIAAEYLTKIKGE